MECYYINLKSEKSRSKNVEYQLSKINNIHINRFEAIDGKSIMNNLNEYDDNLTKFTKLFSTPKIIGCGLSHIMLSKQILKNHDNKNKYYLICEDDVVINNSDTQDIHKFIKDTVENISNIDEEWDIIKLHSVVLKLFGKPIIEGSAVCYLISHRGLVKLSKLRLQYHIDIQINNGFNLHNVENNIVSTLDNDIEYNNFILNKKIAGQKIGWHLNQDIMRVLDFELKEKHLICFILLTFIVSMIKNDYTEIFSLLFVLITIFVYVYSLSNTLNILPFHNFMIIQTIIIMILVLFLNIKAIFNSNMPLYYLLKYMLLYLIIIHVIKEMTYNS